jgi:hypothetical protein
MRRNKATLSITPSTHADRGDIQRYLPRRSSSPTTPPKPILSEASSSLPNRQCVLGRFSSQRIKQLESPGTPDDGGNGMTSALSDQTQFRGLFISLAKLKTTEQSKNEQARAIRSISQHECLRSNLPFNDNGAIEA